VRDAQPDHGQEPVIKAGCQGHQKKRARQGLNQHDDFHESAKPARGADNGRGIPIVRAPGWLSDETTRFLLRTTPGEGRLPEKKSHRLSLVQAAGRKSQVVAVSRLSAW